ncbi:MAG: hypothetical protein V3T23_08390 [Nitrososphaerales archaeon]
MALKSGGLSHRHETTMDFILNRAAAPGTVVVASGVAGQVAIVSDVELAAGDGSGLNPVGVLLNTREVFNYAKELERVQYDTDDIGTVVTLLRRGEVDTDLVLANGGIAIAAGQPAYLAQDGKIGNANLAPSGALSDHQRMGQFMSATDGDGFAKVRIEIQ